MHISVVVRIYVVVHIYVAVCNGTYLCSGTYFCTDADNNISLFKQPTATSQLHLAVQHVNEKKLNSHVAQLNAVEKITLNMSTGGTEFCSIIQITAFLIADYHIFSNFIGDIL